MTIESIFVQHLVFPLADLKSLSVILIVSKLHTHLVPFVTCENLLILHRNTIQLALLNQLLILVVS